MRMKLCISTAVVFLFAFTFGSFAQVPINTGIQILKAEDARRFDAVLENLMRSPSADVRARAALAAGRIGDEKAIPVLADMLMDRKNSGAVWTMAVFALGEIESVKGADSVITVIKAESAFVGRDHDLLSRAFEAAGKIAAANAKDPVAKELGEVIVEGLKLEGGAVKKYPDVLRSALTAILRAKPADGEKAVKPFLAFDDPNVVATALNTLARLRAKTASPEVRKLLADHADAVVRANAARVLGGAEDKDSFDLLMRAAMDDPDSRVRVSAIRSLGSLKDAKAADKLIKRGNHLLIPMHGDPGPIRPGQKIGNLKPIEVPLPKSELLEIATVVGRLLANTENVSAINFLTRLRAADKYQSTETEIAFARVAPKAYLASQPPLELEYTDFHAASAYGQGLAEIASLKDAAMNAKAGELLTKFVAGMTTGVKPADQAKMLKSMPDLTGAIASLKPDNLGEILRGQLLNADVYIRAAAAGAIADMPVSQENLDALNIAWDAAFIKDKQSDDASLAILDALFKLDKRKSLSAVTVASASRDYLVRKKAFEMLKDVDLVQPLLAKARENKLDQVLAYSGTGSKLGVILNTDLDYRRALSRKNGSVKALLTTEKGTFTIVFNPEEAPLTVDNWVKLARSGYFNGLEVNRVVANFVIQDGDPRGDGNGGPGWSIRCEVNMLGYDRGAVGMALSGKDTGGSQWFVTHSPQPHLDGGYTVFGHVSETDMKVVDSIVRGDKILKVTIVGR